LEKAEDTGLETSGRKTVALLSNGKIFELAIGKDAGAPGYYAKVSGRDPTFVIDAGKAMRLMELTKQLLKQ